MLEKMVEAFYTKGINCSYKVIIRGIKLPGNLQKIVGGEFYKEYTSYCYKDIRGIKLQGRVSKGYH